MVGRIFYFMSSGVLFVLAVTLSYLLMAPALDEFGIIETLLSLVAIVLCFGMGQLSLKMASLHSKDRDQLEMSFKCKR